MEALPVIIVIPPTKLKLGTQRARIDALGLGDDRYYTLYPSFLQCEIIDKRRNITSIAGKEIFAAEVQQWLEGELSASDRRNIYNNPNHQYHPGQVVYIIAAFFKRKCGEKLVRKQMQAAAAIALAPAPVPAGREGAEEHPPLSPVLSIGAENGRALTESPNRFPEDDEIDQIQDFNYQSRAQVPEDYPMADDTPGLNMANNLLFSSPIAGRESSPEPDQIEHDEFVAGIPEVPSPYPAEPASPYLGQYNQLSPEPVPFFWSSPFENAPEHVSPAGTPEPENPYPDLDHNHLSPAGTPEQVPFIWNSPDANDSESPIDTPKMSPTPGSSPFVDSPLLQAAKFLKPRHRKRNFNPENQEEELSPLQFKRAKIAAKPQQTMLSFQSHMNEMFKGVVGLTKDSRKPIISEIYKSLWDAINKPDEMNDVVPAAHVTRSQDAALTARRYVNYHIRVRGAIEPVQPILDRGEPSFQNIWGPDAKNGDIARPFKELLMATVPVFLVAAGYSAGGKTHSLLMPNINDPPVLEVLLGEALLLGGGEPLEVTTVTMVKKSTVRAKYTIDSAEAIQQFLQMLQTPGVGDDNGINPASSRKHVLVEARRGRKQLLSVLDLCGDETSNTRAGRLMVESNGIAADLGYLRTLVDQLRRHTPGGPIFGSRICHLTKEFAQSLDNFPKVHMVFFCNGAGDPESMSRLCNQWKPKVNTEVAAGAVVPEGAAVAGAIFHVK